MYQLPIVEAYYFKMVESNDSGVNHTLTGLMKKVNGNNRPVPKVNYNIFKNR